MGKVSTKCYGRYGYFTIFSVISVWRIASLWRGSINEFHQDEISWSADSTSRGFFEYVGMPDSGYPTPFLRAILWIAMRALAGNPTYIHTLSVLIVAFCCTSVLFLKGFGKQDLAKVAIVLGCFPSSDLLLWHNLSYYGFIPLMVTFFNDISQSRRQFPIVLGMQILIVFSCKPQLLIAYLSILYLLGARNVRRNISVTLMYVASSILPLYLLIIGRQNSHSLQLQISSREFAIGFVALAIAPIAIIFPAIFVGVAGFLRMHSQSMLIGILEMSLVAAQNIILIKKRTQIKSIIDNQHKQIILVSGVPLYVSLFIFGNSTWGNDFFWNIQCTECLFQRHVFPIIVLFAFSLLQIRSNLLRKTLIISLVVQILVLAIFAYSKLYGII